jgi:hypothetical protein
MAPVTIETTAQNSYYSAGNIGWSARSLFAYRTAIQQIVHSAYATFGGSATTAARAQSFTPGANMDVNEIRVPIIKTASPTDNVTLSIYSDTGANLPNASIQAADNVYNGAAISTTPSWLSFQFATPVSLTSGTKYWFVVERSGAVDGTNFYSVSTNTGSVYAGGGQSILVSGTWGAESATIDLTFQILTETPSALYSIVQDTSGLKLRAYKSTDDGANWTEQDSANAPAVTNANYPYDSCDTRSGPYLGTARFTATNTMRARLFNMSTDTWGADLGAADAATAASNERTIRISLDNSFTVESGTQVIAYTSSADDADLLHTRRTTSTWTQGTIFAAFNSTEACLYADVVVDKTPIGFQHRFWYDVLNDDYFDKSLTGTTQGTSLALSTSAADVETEHASAVYQIYQNASNVDTVIAAFIDSTGGIRERICNLEVTSASVTMAADNSVDTIISIAGRQLSTASFNGTRYVARGGATSIGYYTSTVAGTWSSVVGHFTGGTATTLSQILSIEGYGLAVAYTNNGTATFDWIVAPTGGGASMDLAAPATAAAAGEAVTLDAASKLTAGTATAPAQGEAVTLKGQGRLAVTESPAPAAGQNVNLAAASKLTVAVATAPAQGEAVNLAASAAASMTLGTPATAPAAGQAVTLTGQGKLTVTQSTAPAQGEAVTFDAASKMTVGIATASAAGQAVTLIGQGRLAVAVATAPAQGEAVDLTGEASVAGTLTVTAATAAAQGEAVTFDAAAKLMVTVATAPAAGQNVLLVGNVALIVTTATAPAQGEAVTLDAASKMTLTAATAAAQGEAVNLTAATGANLSVTPATAAAQGEAVTLDAAAKLTVAVATAAAAGQAVNLTRASRLIVTEATAPAAGQAVTFDAASRMVLAPATAPAAGENVALSGGLTGVLSITPATAAAAGQGVTLDAASSLIVTAAAASAAGQAVTFDAAAKMTLATPAAAPATGEAVVLAGLAQLTVTPALAAAQGEGVTLDVAAVMLLTPALADAAAAGLLEGGSIGDLWFRPRTHKVLVFRVTADPVLGFDAEVEPVLAFAGKGNFDGN